MYLIMSLGLAYDKNQVGTPDELLHRPFVWAYFVVCSWVAGAIYMWKFGNYVPRWLTLSLHLDSGACRTYDGSVLLGP